MKKVLGSMLLRMTVASLALLQVPSVLSSDFTATLALQDKEVFKLDRTKRLADIPNLLSNLMGKRHSSGGLARIPQNAQRQICESKDHDHDQDPGQCADNSIAPHTRRLPWI